MKPFIVNRHGRLVFPSNCFPELDFSVLGSLQQLSSVIKRDFESKAPTATHVIDRIDAGNYATKFDLLRDIGLHLFWVTRYGVTMYDKRPTRWRDVPRGRDDVFLPVLTPWVDAEHKIAAVAAAYEALPAAFDPVAEDRIFKLLFDVFRHKRHHAGELPPIKPTVAEFLANPEHRTLVIANHDPDYPVFRREEILDCRETVPELEALLRWSMVIHNQYPWNRASTTLAEVARIRDDDFVVLFHPRNHDILDFIQRVKAAGSERTTAPRARPDTRSTIQAQPPVRPYPPIEVRKQLAIMPSLEALAVVKGERVCTNVDLIRYAACNWSPMSADEIMRKTGIEQRLYTEQSLENIALAAAAQALDKAGRRPAEIGAVLVCTCTSARLLPSIAAWISGELGMYQTHASCDIVSACAGMSYGLAEAVRLIQEVNRPVLLVCAEKFSDKIGSVRTSRMIFGDGAAAFVVAPARAGEPPDIEVLQTYASGPACEVNSIIWPNPHFDNNITVFGPDVRNLAQRYLVQMMAELRELTAPEGHVPLLDTIELIVPHQANRTMVTTLAEKAGVPLDKLYFNIEKMGNVSAASIPLAIFDAVREGVIKKPTRIFAPGFGAGAVGGYAVLRIDPEIVATSTASTAVPSRQRHTSASSSDDVRAAFGD
jgi:3-oxoacyl-(acyl-carrier-protein) synthase III